MASFPATWALCGGWAIDAWLNRTTREHGDVDISVFATDQQALFEHLRGWQLLPHGPSVGEDNADPWDGARLEPPAHIHARPDTGEALPSDGIAKMEQGFIVEFQIDDRSGDDWILSREPRITFPVRDAIQESAWGVPVVAPEVLLFFKSRDLRRRDKLDFARALPLLSAQQRGWLSNAIALLGHPWQAELSR
ncbi:MAG: hypothetical protein WD359_06070 [Dehalococcoidia bacterium]